jgi:tetratricopeptide (TPR) repeat protein
MLPWLAMRPFGWALAVISVVACASPSHAAEGDIERAGALFEEGAMHYRAGRFDEAIERLEEAYQLAGEPVLLFNLAKAYEGKGDLEKAIDAYERYLDDAPDVADRGAIEARVETLRAQLAARAALERRAEEERLRADRAERGAAPSPWPWIVTGAGVAATTAGVVMGALASDRDDAAAAEPIQQEAAPIREDAESLATGANVAFVVGGALIAGGVVWGIVDLSLSGPADSVAVGVGVGRLDVAIRLP